MLDTFEGRRQVALELVFETLKLLRNLHSEMFEFL
jgi:hypothetical protein